MGMGAFDRLVDESDLGLIDPGYVVAARALDVEALMCRPVGTESSECPFCALLAFVHDLPSLTKVRGCRTLLIPGWTCRREKARVSGPSRCAATAPVSELSR